MERKEKIISKNVVLLVVLALVLILVVYMGYLWRNGYFDKIVYDKGYDKACIIDEDCISTCSCGCINKDEYCISDEAIDCMQEAYDPSNCECIDNQCEFVKKEYHSAEDIYDNFSAYQGKYVEFEGYIIYAYECPPCPVGAACEACLMPYYLAYKEPSEHNYYQPEYIILTNIQGEEPEVGKKYKIDGKALSFEDAEAQPVNIIGTIPENPMVVELTEIGEAL